MLKKARVLLPVIAVIGLIAVIPGSSNADENVFGKCPDGYTPTPFVAAPEEDRNDNGVVCVKPVDGHINTHDDPNGQPYRCNGLQPPAGCTPTTPEDANALIGDDLVE